MRPIVVTIGDIKNLRDLCNANQQLKDDNYRNLGYTYDYNGQDAIIEAKEAAINRNVEIYMNLLGVSYCVIMDMVWDFEFAADVLADVYKNVA